MASCATVELIFLLRSGASLRLWHSALSLLAPFSVSVPNALWAHFYSVNSSSSPIRGYSCRARAGSQGLPCFSHNFHTCAGAPHGTTTSSARTPGTTPYIVLPQIDASALAPVSPSSAPKRLPSSTGMPVCAWYHL
ncbi:hypothetical protein B0H13DRAFT_2356765 [Mycena leptocephala]|nr:hypothetical protein B0H13DRAFT_2356765 [Mycena leptocephala]